MGKRVDIINGEKPCSKCKASLPIENFSPSNYTTCGLRSECKTCLSAQDKVKRRENPEFVNRRRESVRKSYAKDIEKSRERSRSYSIKITKNGLQKGREYQLKSVYNLSPQEYLGMIKSQNNKCLTCSSNFINCNNGAFVDHDHKTGKIRGLLCRKCNTAIGLLQEDISTFENIIKYLKDNGNYCGND